jgi:glycine C-acetyltransferase/8-amino-7-oxononanoate synthase
LRDNCNTLRNGVKALGYSLGNSSSQILPLIVGDAGACMKLSKHLLSRDVFAQGIRPPTVPPGTSRLRITVMATHTEDHLRQALMAFDEAAKGMRVENRG